MTTQFEQAWGDLCHSVRRKLHKKEGLPADIPLPAPADVAEALITVWGNGAGPMWIALLEKTRPRLGAVNAATLNAGEQAQKRYGGELVKLTRAVFQGDLQGDDAAQVGGLLSLVMPMSDLPPDPDTLIAGFQYVHTLWEIGEGERAGLKHPLAALIEAWLRRPREVEPSDIHTFQFFMMHKDQDRTGRYALPAHFGRREGRQMVLPGFEAEHESGIYLPEEVYRLAEREGARRGVVSLAQRALIYAMLRTPSEKAASPTGYWFRVPGKEYIAVTNQANKEIPKPNKWLPALRGTRDILNTFDLPYTDADGKPRFFIPVAIMDYPLDAQDEIGFVTQLPEGYGGTGVRISPRLWEYTNHSHIFYMMLSAPFLYDQPGITWRPRKGGGVSHFKDVEAYPTLTRPMLANMANPFADGRTRRRLEQEAFDLVEEVARLTGAFQIAKRKDARIILPPRDQVNVDKSAKAKGFAIVRYEG